MDGEREWGVPFCNVSVLCVVCPAARISITLKHDARAHGAHPGALGTSKKLIRNTSHRVKSEGKKRGALPTHHFLAFSVLLALIAARASSLNSLVACEVCGWGSVALETAKR